MKLHRRGDWSKTGPSVDVPDPIGFLPSDPVECRAILDHLVRECVITREQADRFMEDRSEHDPPVKP